MRFDPEGHLGLLVRVNSLVDMRFCEVDPWVPWSFLIVVWGVERVCKAIAGREKWPGNHTGMLDGSVGMSF